MLTLTVVNDCPVGSSGYFLLINRWLDCLLNLKDLSEFSLLEWKPSENCPRGRL